MACGAGVETSWSSGFAGVCDALTHSSEPPTAPPPREHDELGPREQLLASRVGTPTWSPEKLQLSRCSAVQL